MIEIFISGSLWQALEGERKGKDERVKRKKIGPGRQASEVEGKGKDERVLTSLPFYGLLRRLH